MISFHPNTTNLLPTTERKARSSRKFANLVQEFGRSGDVYLSGNLIVFEIDGVIHVAEKQAVLSDVRSPLIRVDAPNRIQKKLDRSKAENKALREDSYRLCCINKKQAQTIRALLQKNIEKTTAPVFGETRIASNHHRLLCPCGHLNHMDAQRCAACNEELDAAPEEFY